MRQDDQGSMDICRVTYTPVAEEARNMCNHLKLSMNKIMTDLTTLSHINPNPEVKRLLAMAITELEFGTLAAAKAMFTESFVHAKPGNDQAPSPTK